MTDPSFGRRLAFLAVREMVFAVHAPSFLIRLVHAEGDAPPIKQEWVKTTLLKPTTIRFLRAKNAEGYHVYGRPDTTRHVMVDDVDADGLDALARDGLRPSLIVETSKANFQAWVTLSTGDIDPHIATAAAHILAKTYGGDAGAAHARQLGRLPGFRNRKAIYENGGRYPLVMIRSATPHVAARAELLLEKSKAVVAKRPPPSTQGGCDPDPLVNESSLPTKEEARAIYGGAVKVLTVRFGMLPSDDRSRVDFAVARHLAWLGYDSWAIARILLHASSKAVDRGEAYAIRTAAHAFRSTNAEQGEGRRYIAPRENAP